MNTLHLAQTLTEEIYSRRNIRNEVLEEIDTGEDSFIWPMAEAIANYRNDKTYYDSKLKRIDLIDLNNVEIAIEMHIAVLPIDGIKPIQQVVSKLGSILDYDEELDGFKTAGELLAVCRNIGLYKLITRYSKENDTNTLAIQSLYTLSNKTLEFIERTSYLPPMMVEPREWTTTTNGGYLSSNDNVMLGRINEHNKQVDLTAINKLQRVPYSFNLEMLEMEEKANKPFETEEQEAQFNLHVKETRRISEELVDHGNEFYFPHKCDFRRRIYSCGYHVNLQGTKYKRAVLEFTEKHIIEIK